VLPHLLKAGVESGPALEKLKRYAQLTLEWNRSVSNVVSRHDEPRFVERHISESVEPAAWLKAGGGARWIDFGSGAGLPAIPLAIAGVGSEWTLVESRRMKTLFMRKAKQELGLEQLEIVLSRLESMREESARMSRYDGFTSRATLALGPTLELAAAFVKPGGKAFLWKGSQREAEMKADERWRETWELDGLLGIGNGQTVIVRFTRKG
jgi:16S rRNA (guanine527-N7)-methyltransferase